MTHEEMPEQERAIGDDQDYEDRRQEERYEAEAYLCVYERNEERLLGHIIDVSLSGMRLLGEEALPIGQVMSLRMEVFLESGQCESVEFEAQPVWSRPDEECDEYNTGFLFVNLSAQAYEVLQLIIDELSD